MNITPIKDDECSFQQECAKKRNMEGKKEIKAGKLKVGSQKSK